MTRSHDPTSAPMTAAAEPRSSRAGDALFVLLFSLFWFTHVIPLVVFEERRPYDVFRDIGAAVNFQQGQWRGDPALHGETPWYPPLSPLIVAGVSSATGLSPGDCYRWSALVVNWLIPVGLFMLVRQAWGTRAAWGAVVAMLFAMPWWQTHVAAGEPSVHAVISGWIGLGLYARSRRRGSRRRAAICGVFLGLACFHHPLIPLTLTATIALHGGWEAWRLRGTPGAAGQLRAQLARTAWVVVPAALIGGTVAAWYQHGPVRNPEPREYLAAELRTLEFALLGGNPWPWGLGVVGLACAVRRGAWPGRLLAAGLAVCVAGQMPGYLRLYGPAALCRVPVVVPHQFQMLFQLGWAVCIGVGIDSLVRAVVARLPAVHRRACPPAWLAAGCLALTGAWGLLHAGANLRRYLIPFRVLPESRAVAEWIRTHTDIQDVFVCDPGFAYLWLNPETGRKVWLLPRGHSNPRVDWEARLATFMRLKQTESPAEFCRLARDAGIQYILATGTWTPRVIGDPDLARQTVPRCLEPVYEFPGQAIILRIRDDP